MAVYPGDVFPANGVSAVGKRRQPHRKDGGVIGVYDYRRVVYPGACGVQHLDLAQGRFDGLGEPDGDPAGRVPQHLIGRRAGAAQVGVGQRRLREGQENRRPDNRRGGEGQKRPGRHQPAVTAVRMGSSTSRHGTELRPAPPDGYDGGGRTDYRSSSAQDDG